MKPIAAIYSHAAEVTRNGTSWAIASLSWTGIAPSKICGGGVHRIDGTWDLLIAHPPCTYLTAAGAVRLYSKDHSIKDQERYNKGIEAAAFFQRFLNADCPKIAIENPVPMKCFGLPRASQIIEPYMFGDPWRKRTCLWLKGLPPLIMTEAPEIPKGLWVGSTSQRRDPTIKQRYILHSNRDPKRRSRTFQGIGRAMAEQWAGRNP